MIRSCVLERIALPVRGIQPSTHPNPPISLSNQSLRVFSRLCCSFRSASAKHVPCWCLNDLKVAHDFFLIPEDLCVLDFVILRTYVRAAKFERISTLPRKPNFARYLRDARIKRRLSVAEVAEQVGVSTASIYFWETDHVRPRDANLNALCKVLKLPIRATREMAAA